MFCNYIIKNLLTGGHLQTNQLVLLKRAKQKKYSMYFLTKKKIKLKVPTLIPSICLY